MSGAGGGMRWGGSVRRIRGLMRKEWLQVWRDPSSFTIALVLPVVLLVLFGYGVSLDPYDVPVAVVVEQPTPDANDFVASLANSRYFRAEVMPGRHRAETMLADGEVDGVVVLRQDFDQQLNRGATAPIQVLVDGTNANRARLVEGYVRGAWASWLVQRSAEDASRAPPGIGIENRVWFNAAVESRNFIVPGLVAIIMTLIGALLTAVVVAREWERGTMEALMATPIRPREILLGKLVPYFVLGMGGMVLSVVMAVFMFGVPLRGSLSVLFGTSAVFMLTSLGLGLFISTLAKSQFVAAQAAIIGTMLPAIMLSGFIFDISAMPGWVQAVTYIVPARYFVAILQTVFLAGDVGTVIWPNLAALAAFATILITAAVLRTRRSLE